MTGNSIQADYEQLDAMAARFGQSAAATDELYNRIRHSAEDLAQDGWEGRGSAAFAAEMSGNVFPACARLTDALWEGQKAVRQIITVLRQAEEEAAALFGGDSSGDSADTRSKKQNASSREAQVQRLIDAGDRDGAVKAAIQLYNIDISAAKGQPAYSKSVRGEGITSINGTINIGDKAFSSPGWLASSIGHEALHARQLKEGRWDLKDTKDGVALNEVECYDWEISHAGQNGLNAKDVVDLTRRRKSYYDQLSSPIKDRVNHGNYTLP
jgi:WXG100 family type VII secretion target